MISGARIVVTGGAGFIASHIIDRLVHNNTLVVYDNMKRNALRYSPHHHHPNVTIIEGDVLDAAKLDECIQGADICVHAAAIAGIYSVGDSITRTMKVNLIGAYNALESAAKHKVGRFMDFSTSEIYGPYSYRSTEDDVAKVGPASEKRWIYAISKLAGEHFAHAYGEDFGLKVVTVRPFNVYGPRQVGEGAVQQMVGRALKNVDITVFNEGTQIRSWCFVDDFADAFVTAMESDAAVGQVFNIGNPQATTTVLGLAETLIRLTGSTSKIVFKPHPGPEVEIRMPDIAKARRLLQFGPRVGLDDGLKRAIAWYREVAS
ncbi:MAG TPA: NAD-dependent epimerase/dehydratase family protein [Usitatibacter sp.]|nr:NAD-dependent epimerase/dehydratase family protein [Usitatibacter sp.]